MYEENKRKTSSEAKVMPGSSRNPWGPHSKRGQKSRTAQTAQPPTQKQFYSRGNHHRRWILSARAKSLCVSILACFFFLSFFLSFFALLLFSRFPLGLVGILFYILQQCAETTLIGFFQLGLMTWVNDGAFTPFPRSALFCRWIETCYTGPEVGLAFDCNDGQSTADKDIPKLSWRCKYARPGSTRCHRP